MITDKFLMGRRGIRLAPNERAGIEAAVAEIRKIAPRSMLVEAGRPLRRSAMVVDGLMGRYIDDRDGLRQLVALHLPGDFIDLPSFTLGYLEHSIASLTSATIAIVPHENIRVLQANDDISRALWFATLLDAAMHRVWLFRLGRLDAMGRIAHFLCETGARLSAVGLSDGRRFDLALTQNDLAEICGVTGIHMNRILRQLREEGLCTYRSSQVEILRPQALAARGQFDPTYLYLEQAATPGD